MEIFRISHYATASTDTATFILGGLGGSLWGDYERISTIAEYKNNEWSKIGDLNGAKSGTSAILHNEEYLVVGGDSKSSYGR